MKSIRIAVIMALCLPFTAVQGYGAITGGQVLKGAAIAYAVKQSGKQLNTFINGITLRNKMQTRMATKVVPILSVGEKGYIGGAQVSGPQVEINKVQAVFQYEKNVSNNNYRVKVLVPSGSLNPLALKRVPKAGVTAIIDVSLDGRLKNGTVGTGIQAGDVIKGAGVLVLVKNIGPTINNAINSLTLNKGYGTKFVPWGSIGDKAYVGGAQVSASTATIGKVNAVWQYDGLFGKGTFRVKVMVPTTSSNPLKMKRVDGAGVTAVVDLALSEQKKPEVRKTRTTPLSTVLGTKSATDAKIQHQIDTGKDNGKHKGWTQGKHKGRKNPQVDQKWREKLGY